MEILLLTLLIFFTLALLAYGIYRYTQEFLLKRRLSKLVKPNPSISQKRPAPQLIPLEKFNHLIQKMNELSKPSEGWQESEIKLKFIRAGWRGESVPTTFFAVKTGLFVGLPTLFIILAWFSLDLPMLKLLMFALIFAVIGYYLPEFIVNNKVAERKQQMQNALPDFIDLLVMCSAAGLGLDAALNRVSLEMAKASPILAEEFYLTCLGIRAGESRIEALKSLALRVDLDDLTNLVTMLVQADKFGTSLTESLKIQSDFMRSKRMQRAEAMAAKIPVKMLLPLILLIFPVLMMVLVGPAFIQMSSAFK
jgi:tight adherence protein C